MCRSFFILLLLSFRSFGQFAPPVGEQGSTAIKNTSAKIIGWATTSEVIRGWADIADTTIGKVDYGEPSDAIGESNPQVVSLGDGGSAVLTFAEPIKNKEGFDFAVFENSFDDSFLELAFVEVSSNGIYFVRFPCVSNTQTETQIETFGTIDATEINNLAGKYRVQYGTPFDLEELKDSSKVNIDSIVYVKIIDVVGSIDSTFATFDSHGNIINDPYPTAFGSGGFDLDAVAILDDSIEELSTIPDEFDVIKIYPNPVIKGQILMVKNKGILLNSVGGVVQNVDTNIDTAELTKGLYFYKTKNSTQKLIIQ